MPSGYECLIVIIIMRLHTPALDDAVGVNEAALLGLRLGTTLPMEDRYMMRIMAISIL